MKKTKLFGTVLCSAALACGMAMPAFAAGSVDGNFNEWSSGSGNTLVKGTTSEVPVVADVIKAKVPVSMSVVLGEGGSGDFTAPTSSAYKLYNTGNVPIIISSVTASAANADWTLKASNAMNNPTAADKWISLSVNKVELDATGKSIGTSTIAAGADLGLTVEGKTAVGTEITTDDTFDMANITYTIAKATA